MLLLKVLEVFPENTEDAAFQRLLHDPAKLRHLKFFFNCLKHPFNLMRYFRVCSGLFCSSPNQTPIFVIRRLQGLRNLVLQLHNALTLVKESIFVHATSLIEKSFPKFAAVVFAAFELLRKVEVLNLALRFFGHVSN
jgi:hypothetical protein